MTPIQPIKNESEAGVLSVLIRRHLWIGPIGVIGVKPFAFQYSRDMPSASTPQRSFSNTFVLLALWIAFYASFTLFTPALLDDADSVHAEVAREMLLRHDWTTLYANGIRYLEKAPLLYWSMAASMRVSQLFGYRSANALAVAARIPLALTILALAFAVEVFARSAFRSARAGLYAALILLSSFGVFLFTRITIPDAMLCLWLTLALLCFWLTESTDSNLEPRTLNLLCCAFSACCALGVLTKGLIGILFPAAIVAIYLVATRGWKGAANRMLELHPLARKVVFLAIAAPWHILIAFANPTQGHPGNLTFSFHPAAGAGHWQVPLPTDGNVHGWTWFYFVNEQLLRYLNLRVPRDYDTVPLYLFWGLILIWLMPWSAFIFKAVIIPLRRWTEALCDQYRAAPRLAELHRAAISEPRLFFMIWAAVPLLFFSLSTRQEYYVLPSLPALALLLAGWLRLDTYDDPDRPRPLPEKVRRINLRCTAALLALGTIFAASALYFILHTRAPSANTDLAALLQQNPGDYAMSMGHFLDLNAQALGLFRLPLAIAAASLFLGPLVSLILRRRARPHAATLALAAGAFGFLLAAHLGLRTFAQVLSSQQLAAAIAPQLHPDDLIVIHQEYEYGSTLGFYLQRPSYRFVAVRTSPPQTTAPTDHDSAEVTVKPVAVNSIHILTDAEYHGTPNYGRSSNLWYGSFFPDAPAIFETPQTLAQKWSGKQRIFLWQDLGNQPNALPASLSPVYVIAKSGGKEIVSNQP
jgi:4-amino-4-deoxy-L-arabinose transferase-like glycosyltransferase